MIQRFGSGPRLTSPATMGLTLTDRAPALWGEPTLLSVAPNYASVGTQIQLTGNKFTLGGDVTINGVPVDNKSIDSDTTITCDVPSLSAGLYDIAVGGSVLENGFAVPTEENNFEGFADTAALRADNAMFVVSEDLGPTSTKSHLDTVEAVDINGWALTKSLRLDFDPVACDTSISLGKAMRITGTPTEGWFRVYWRTNSNYRVFGCAAGGAQAHKFAFLQNTPSGDGRWAVTFHYSAGLNTEHPKVSNGATEENASCASILDQSFFGDGWHWMDIHFKYASDASASDGVLEVGIDGTRYVNRTGLYMGIAGSYIDRLLLSRNKDDHNNALPGTESLYFGLTQQFNFDPQFPGFGGA